MPDIFGPGTFVADDQVDQVRRDIETYGFAYVDEDGRRLDPVIVERDAEGRTVEIRFRSDSDPA